MHDIIDLDRYPLHDPASTQWRKLVELCRLSLATDGLFNLPGFLKPDSVISEVAMLQLLLDNESFTHARQHNIYFKKSVADLPPDHPALREFKTSNRTVCADQLPDSALLKLYQWPPFASFLAAAMQTGKLFCMHDPLARVNVMAYSRGQALNWHFDRAEFTTTALLQAPVAGGEFEYCKDLRSDTDPHYGDVAALLDGRKTPTRLTLHPGTLNVFKGKNTAHRVSSVKGQRDRIIAVFSFFEHPGVSFTDAERIGFYGRAQ